MQTLSKTARTLARLVRDAIFAAVGIAGLVGIAVWSGGDLERAAIVFTGFAVAWGFGFATTSRWL